MAGTNQQLLDHIVFSTKNHKPYLSAGHRNGFDTHLAIDPGPYGTRQGLCGPFGPKTGNDG